MKLNIGNEVYSIVGSPFVNGKILKITIDRNEKVTEEIFSSVKELSWTDNMGVTSKYTDLNFREMYEDSNKNYAIEMQIGEIPEEPVYEEYIEEEFVEEIAE